MPEVTTRSLRCPRCAASSWLYDGDRFACLLCGHEQEIPRQQPSVWIFGPSGATLADAVAGDTLEAMTA